MNPGLDCSPSLSIWYTIQVSPHSRIQEAIFERTDHMPSDDEVNRWLRLLIIGPDAVEAPGLPGSMTRRFEAFERNPDREAPLAGCSRCTAHGASDPVCLAAI
jgi:hypothetical protein